MSSGNSFPEAVKLVDILKPSGGTRPLDIPTVGEYIAKMSMVLLIKESPLHNSMREIFMYGSVRMKCLGIP